MNNNPKKDIKKISAYLKFLSVQIQLAKSVLMKLETRKKHLEIEINKAQENYIRLAQKSNNSRMEQKNLDWVVLESATDHHRDEWAKNHLELKKLQPQLTHQVQLVHQLENKREKLDDKLTQKKTNYHKAIEAKINP